MNLPPARLSILLLTEDSASDAHDTLAALAKRMLQVIAPAFPTHLIDWRPANEDAKRAMHANRWKSENPRDHRKLVDLRRTIARKIIEPGGLSFVLFHADGDCLFSRREGSENRQKFAEKILHGVQQLVVDELQAKGSLLELSSTMARLRLLMPFYSVEAWLYQNTREAIRICHARYGGEDVDRFEEWEKDRRALDEVDRPKEQTRIGSRHNLELSKSGFPADEIYDAGMSFAESIEGLLDCSELMNAIERVASLDGDGGPRPASR